MDTSQCRGGTTVLLRRLQIGQAESIDWRTQISHFMQIRWTCHDREKPIETIAKPQDDKQTAWHFYESVTRHGSTSSQHRAERQSKGVCWHKTRGKTLSCVCRRQGAGQTRESQQTDHNIWCYSFHGCPQEWQQRDALSIWRTRAPRKMPRVWQ